MIYIEKSCCNMEGEMWGKAMNQIKTGKYIAEKRKKKGLTQKELAEKLLVSDKAVSKWERGICLPNIELIKPLSEILDISIDALLSGED